MTKLYSKLDEKNLHSDKQPESSYCFMCSPTNLNSAISLFSSTFKGYIVLSFIFSSLTLHKFIFVYDMRKGPILFFIWLFNSQNDNPSYEGKCSVIAIQWKVFGSDRRISEMPLIWQHLVIRSQWKLLQL